MTESELERAEREINKVLNTLKTIKANLDTAFDKSTEIEKKKDRSFQVRMLQIQLRHDIITSSLTAIIAVAFAFLVLSLTVINSSDIPVPTKQLLLPYIIPLLVGGVVAFGALLAISFAEIQWREIKNLKKDFVENKDTETKAK